MAVEWLTTQSAAALAMPPPPSASLHSAESPPFPAVATTRAPFPRRRGRALSDWAGEMRVLQGQRPARRVELKPATAEEPKADRPDGWVVRQVTG